MTMLMAGYFPTQSRTYVAKINIETKLFLLGTYIISHPYSLYLAELPQ